MPVTYTVEKFETGMHYLQLDKKTALALTRHGNKRAICTINGAVSFHCAIMNKKEGWHFINVGLSVCKKLGIKKGAKVTATFTPDTTKYQFDMPEELQEVLQTDPEASRIFHSLTEGNQRGLIYLVGQVKSVDKKIERALKIATRLKGGIISPRVILK